MKRRAIPVIIVFLLFLLEASNATFAAVKKPKKIKLNKTQLTLYVGESSQLTVSVKPAGANSSVKWKSSNSKVVTVSSKGKLKAKKAGSAKITCTSKKNPKVKAVCKVKVTPILTDKKELETARLVLARTAEPIYRYKFKKESVSSKRGSSGYIWFVNTNLNGTINYVEVCDDSGTDIARTYCMYSSPIISHGIETGGSSVRSELLGGTYNFTNDPKKVQIGWSMFSSSTSKEDFEKMINAKISANVFNSVLAKASGNSYYTNSSYGGSCVILYGKNSDGALVGKYAGNLSYNMVSNAVLYNLIGINPENEEDYGRAFSGSAPYA